MFCFAWGTWHYNHHFSWYLSMFVWINLIKGNVSLTFWGQDIPRFDTGSHKSYITLYAFSGAYIIRPNRPLTIKEETDDGRCEMYSLLDFHFQYIAQLAFYSDFYADDATKAFKNVLWHHYNTILIMNIHITWHHCSRTIYYVYM